MRHCGVVEGLREVVDFSVVWRCQLQRWGRSARERGEGGLSGCTWVVVLYTS
jgi:hypothetical protein